MTDQVTSESGASRRLLHRYMLVRTRWPLWVLLASLTVLGFAYPVTLEGRGWTAAYLLVYGGLFVFAYRLVSLDPRGNWHLPVLSALVVIACAWFAVRHDSTSAQAAMLLTVGVLQLALLTSLVSVLLSPPPRAQTLDLLLVAVCGYLLLGAVFGSVAGVLETAAPGSFLDPHAPDGAATWQSLSYASIVTLTTLGYGDVLPVSAWARSVSSLEAVLGALYLAVVIARLVGVARVPARAQEARS